MAYKPNTVPRYDGDLQLLNNQQLLEEAKSYLAPGSLTFPRDIAAEILDRVAESGEYGGVSEGLNPFIIGVAIRRLARNYSDGDWRKDFMLGLNFNPNTDTIPPPPLMTQD